MSTVRKRKSTQAQKPDEKTSFSKARSPPVPHSADDVGDETERHVVPPRDAASSFSPDLGIDKNSDSGSDSSQSDEFGTERERRKHRRRRGRHKHRNQADNTQTGTVSHADIQRMVAIRAILTFIVFVALHLALAPTINATIAGWFGYHSADSFNMDAASVVRDAIHNKHKYCPIGANCKYDTSGFQ